MDQILSNTNKDEICLILLGNKCDIEKRSISYEQGKTLANELQVNFFETSAQTGQNIKDAFETLTADIKKKKKIGGDNNNIDLKKNKKKKDSDCC